MRSLLAFAASLLLSLAAPAHALTPAQVLLLAGNAAPFTAAQLFLAGQKGAYYDLSDASTVFSDSTCTTPATLNGSIGCIKDKSPNHINVIMATGAFQPVWKSSSGLFWMETNNNNSWIGASFSAGTFGTMDVFFSGQKTSANSVPISAVANSGSQFTEVASSGSGTANNTSGGMLINGVAVNGTSAPTWGQLYTAWTSSTPVEVDGYGTNMSAWVGYGFGTYSTFAGLTRVYRMVVRQTMTTSERAAARTWSAAGAGLAE